MFFISKYVSLQSGRKYNIRKTTFAEYVSDLRRENSRGSSSYLAVQNIRQSFPQLEVSTFYSHLCSQFSEVKFF